jgi:hypothetical protein
MGAKLVFTLADGRRFSLEGKDVIEGSDQDTNTDVENVNISKEDYQISKLSYLNPEQYEALSTEGWFSPEVKEDNIKGYSNPDAAIKGTLQEFGDKISANIASIQEKKKLNLLTAADKKAADKYIADGGYNGQLFHTVVFKNYILILNVGMVKKLSKEKTPDSSKNMYMVGNVAVAYKKANEKLSSITVLRVKLFKIRHAANEE